MSRSSFHDDPRNRWEGRRENGDETKGSGWTDGFGEFDEVGMVVADGNGSDLSVEVEVGVGVGVDEVISYFEDGID